MTSTSDPDSLEVERYLNVGLCKLEPVIVNSYLYQKAESNSSLDDLDSDQSDDSGEEVFQRV